MGNSPSGLPNYDYDTILTPERRFLSRSALSLQLLHTSLSLYFIIFVFREISLGSYYSLSFVVGCSTAHATTFHKLGISVYIMEFIGERVGWWWGDFVVKEIMFCR